MLIPLRDLARPFKSCDTLLKIMVVDDVHKRVLKTFYAGHQCDILPKTLLSHVAASFDVA
jgi:hypothetical protein